jgi:alpha-beta hydrolase superfamily lysophospholipase
MTPKCMTAVLNVRNRIVKLLLILCISNVAAASRAQEIVTLSTRPSVTQSYFVARLPPDPRAIVVLFPGSGGVVNLRRENGRIRFGQNNFLIRVRAEFVGRGIATAFIDAPSDRQAGWGMTDDFRLSAQHATDIAAVVGDLRKRIADAPLFLIGTSRGTISAASLAARLEMPLGGAVLTSTMFRAAGRKSSEPGQGLSQFDFATIKIPLLFVHHVSDQCAVTPYSEAARLAEKYPLITVFGGAPPQSGPCDPFSPHGFFGKERETVEQMVNWMLKKPLEHEIK